ncbi:twin-arginine translocase subunit TatC [Salinicoccus cyprini]|uniref:Sec-independent protein translocase protein TatC n=1 Tax=Salinicoccus cyprini TaxID=2493691 RepID=A0A558AX35_9STAP|nr:twin-arginine translocase subunit TatC [Salinicoccus cyprini]TVT28823.1 twin-arginine translocase subunit TatC [Salinicoccus cyprini]
MPQNKNQNKALVNKASKEKAAEPKRHKVTVETPDATLVEHLEDLRGTLIKSIVSFVFFFMLIFVTIQYWFPYLSKGHDLIVRGPFEVIRFYVRTSGALGIGLSLPFICYFLWQFMRPGLVDKETQFLKAYFPLMFLLFLGGLSFGYFVVHPISYYFLIQMGERNFDVLVTADEYMSFLLLSTMPFGLIFQLPVVVLFLHHIELLDSVLMRKVRKYVYFALFVITALIAPPDFFTHIITVSPMIILYEISIYLVMIKERRAKRKAKAAAQTTE